MVGAQQRRRIVLPVIDSEPCVSLVPIFAGLTPAQQGEVARFARPLLLEAGGFAFRAGEPGSRLFVVYAGRGEDRPDVRGRPGDDLAGAGAW